MPSYEYAHIHINVEDLDAAIAWYENAFGAKLVSKGENLPGRFSASLDINGMRLILSNKLYPLDAPIRHGQAAQQFGLEHFALSVDHFLDAMAELKAKGVRFAMEPHEFRPGTWIAFVEAPEGVLIELMGR